MTTNLIEQARRAALELTADITTGSDWPNTPEEVGRLNTANLLRPLAAALEQRAEVFEAQVVKLARNEERITALESQCAALAQQARKPREGFVEVPVANLDGVIPAAVRGYLRRCSSGGMSKKDIDVVQANVDEADRLGYFKLAIAEAVIAARPKGEGRD